jgi:CheY-like chemotaxis protein
MDESSSSAAPNILVVEDEVLVALMISEMLGDLGCAVAASAGNLRDALALAQSSDLDGAILDLNLAGEPVYPVADVLAAKGVPFVFLTGYGAAGIEPRFADVPTIAKPFHPSALEDAVVHFRR